MKNRLISAILLLTFVFCLSACGNQEKGTSTSGKYNKADLYGQYMYMITGLSCGPRDAFTVAIGKRCKKISIGTVNNVISAIVLAISWGMGATIGIGTVLSVFGMGMVMDLTFKLCRFEPRNVEHEDIITTAKILLTNKE